MIGWASGWRSAALAATVAATAVPDGAPPWEPTQQLSDRSDVINLRSETTAAGTSTVVFEEVRVEEFCTPLYRSVRRPEESAWTAPERVPRARVETSRLAVGGADDTVLAWTSCHAGAVRLQRLRPTGWGHQRHVRLPDRTTAAPLAMNDRRGLAVMWSSYDDAPTRFGGSYRLRGGPWQDLPELTATAGRLRHVALTNAGEVVAVVSTKTDYRVSTYVAGSWTTETIPIDKGTSVTPVIASSPAGHLALGWVVPRSPGSYNYSFVVRFRGRGETFEDPYVLADDRPCDRNADACADLDIDSTGNVTALWSHGSTINDVYRLSRRSVDTGEWSAPVEITQPGYALSPHVDVHARGDAVAWIDTDYGGHEPLWSCRLGADCVAVPYPQDPAPGVFVAGPDGTVTAAFGDDLWCDDWCSLEEINAARLVP